MAEIAIVDDEIVLVQSLKIQLANNGHSVCSFHDGSSFMRYLESQEPDLVFLDLKLPDAHGLDILTHIQEVNKQITTIIITAHGDMDSAIHAMKSGAFDYLNKPFELSEIEILIKNALTTRRLTDEVTLHRQKAYRCQGLSAMKGESTALKKLTDKISRLSSIGATTVLIRGESGTGKELVAKGIHNTSIFANEPFIEVNCASLPENLLESELFGYEKGAFTDARTRKRGLAEMADGGTIFLDEIGEISLPLQAKLLRFLESRSFRRIGGIKEISFNGLILAATNNDLEKSVKEGRFREDLFYRLNVIPITLPPLRDREQDIGILVRYFLDLFAKRHGKRTFQLTQNARDALDSYKWPGNIRELKNIMELLVIMCDGPVINRAHLPPNIIDSRLAENAESDFEPTDIAVPRYLSESSLSEQMNYLERNIIDKALERSRGVKTDAAILLGVSRYTLLRRLKALNGQQ